MAEYIDKKATIADLNKTYDAMSGFHPQFYAGYQFAVNRLKAFPKADVAPVRHARWIPEENGDVYFSCSYCGCEISTGWDYDDLEWNFCPECGCEMDGGADNGE